ncbi:MAG TPA: metallophosphoesterase [Noviherbaspirillum sp.]|nr:metallophosphoesterase [Noviherbaspirillum sp.]
MSHLPAHDEIHVISDLHMGGKDGFQILRETTRLANFIQWVGNQRPDGRVALVLNGDVFDTLAEDTKGYVAVDEAVSTLQRIMDDAAFTGIWDALSEFVRKAARTLVLVIGNHDIELAFPQVQQLILSRLAGEDLSARGRIVFSTVGAGYTCTVGASRVFCTHGNEVDPWNYNRYEDLSRVARRLAAGRSISADEWMPNAGTKMVKDIMNEVKRKFAWIDLLKPETSAAIGTLLVLDPAQAAKIPRLPAIGGRLAQGKWEADQRLAADVIHPTEADASRPPTVDELLGPHLKASLQPSADAMLMAAEENYQRLTPGADDGTLGTGQLIWERLTGWLTGVSKEEALRRALQDWLDNDATFRIDNRDDCFNDVVPTVGSAVDIIVTGHTHLERAIDMGNGRYYFNSGTWIRLLEFSEAMLKDADSFNPVYQVLMDGRMQAIDEAQFAGKPFVKDQCSAVSIGLEDSRVVGRLAHVDANGKPQEIKAFARP